MFPSFRNYSNQGGMTHQGNWCDSPFLAMFSKAEMLVIASPIYHHGLSGQILFRLPLTEMAGAAVSQGAVNRKRWETAYWGDIISVVEIWIERGQGACFGSGYCRNSSAIDLYR